MSANSSALPGSSGSTSGTSYALPTDMFKGDTESDAASTAVHKEQRQRESFSGPVDSDISALANATAKCFDMLSDRHEKGNM